MENFDILKFILPEEFVLHFDLINIETEGEQLIFSLDEKNVKPPEHSNKELASKGFIESVKIFDFPIRGKGVVLIVRRRKWKDKKTRKTYTLNWKLKEKGTSYNKEFAAFLKEIIDNNPVSASSVAKFYCINGSQLAKQYKNHLSKYNEWDQLEHSEQWILYPNNMGETLCLDEIALSNGELYTILTNAKTKTQKGSLIAMIKGVKSENILKILNRIPISLRRKVKEINTYMANTMGKVAKQAFPNAVTVTDRFYVAKLVSDALQEIRNKHRWKAIYLENKEIETAKKTKIKYVSPTFENGNTTMQLLARSRYLLFKPSEKWTDKQSKRAKILFEEYPDIKHAYELSMMFRNIYETAKTKEEAELRFDKWFKKVEQYNYPSFVTASHSINNHKETILNFFINRTTYTLEESFNSKLKAFRNVLRGVRDLSFFIFRVTKIFG